MNLTGIMEITEAFYFKKKKMETMHAIYLGNAWVRIEKGCVDKEIKKMIRKKEGWTHSSHIPWILRVVPVSSWPEQHVTTEKCREALDDFGGVGFAPEGEQLSRLGLFCLDQGQCKGRERGLQSHEARSIGWNSEQQGPEHTKGGSNCSYSGQKVWKKKFPKDMDAKLLWKLKRRHGPSL